MIWKSDDPFFGSLDFLSHQTIVIVCIPFNESLEGDFPAR